MSCEEAQTSDTKFRSVTVFAWPASSVVQTKDDALRAFLDRLNWTACDSGTNAFQNVACMFFAHERSAVSRRKLKPLSCFFTVFSEEKETCPHLCSHYFR